MTALTSQQSFSCQLGNQRRWSNVIAHTYGPVLSWLLHWPPVMYLLHLPSPPALLLCLTFLQHILTHSTVSPSADDCALLVLCCRTKGAGGGEALRLAERRKALPVALLLPAACSSLLLKARLGT
jgi:hypothetical protein